MTLFQKKQKDACYDKCVEWDKDYLYDFEDNSFMCCEFIMMQSGRTVCNFYHDGESDAPRITKDHERFQGQIYTEYFDHTWKATAEKSWENYSSEFWEGGLLPIAILAVGLADISFIPWFFLQDKVTTPGELISLRNQDGSINYGFVGFTLGFDWYPDLARIIIHILAFTS